MHITASYWVPSNSLLNTTDELKTLFHHVHYEGYDELTDTVVPYRVVFTSLQEDPYCLNVVENKIYGYYADSFVNKTVKWLDQGVTYYIVNRFNKIIPSMLREMISFIADPTVSKTFRYRADALDENDNVVDSKEYMIIVNNNWSPGKKALLETVAMTFNPQEELCRWNSGIKFVNSTGAPVKWETKL